MQLSASYLSRRLSEFLGPLYFHFQTPLVHYYDLVSKQAPYGGFILLANRQGDIYLNTGVAAPQTETLQYMSRLDADSTLRGAMQAEVTGGRSSYISGKYHGELYRLTYQAIELATGMKAP